MGIESEMVRTMEEIERKRKEKLEKEASDRLHKQWDIEWEAEKLEKERIWNETHDEDGNEIEVEHEALNDTLDQNENEKKEKKEDEEVAKRYFYQKKPKLVKKKNQNHKIAKEICYFLNEQYDEWLHEKQKIISKEMKEGEQIKDYLVAMDLFRR